MIGLLCRSFVAINRGTNKRQPFDPCGDTSAPSVREGNLLCCRTVVWNYLLGPIHPQTVCIIYNHAHSYGFVSKWSPFSSWKCIVKEKQVHLILQHLRILFTILYTIYHRCSQLAHPNQPYWIYIYTSSWVRTACHIPTSLLNPIVPAGLSFSCGSSRQWQEHLSWSSPGLRCFFGIRGWGSSCCLFQRRGLGKWPKNQITNMIWFNDSGGNNVNPGYNNWTPSQKPIGWTPIFPVRNEIWGYFKEWGYHKKGYNSILKA